MKFLSSSSESTIVPVFFAFFLCIIIVIIISLTTGLSRVTILANALCTVGSNVYDADFVLAAIWLISFAYALIVNNNNDDNNISESNKIYNDDDNISMMPTIILLTIMMSLLLLTIVFEVEVDSGGYLASRWVAYEVNIHRFQRHRGE